jgi:hypothetical protein
MGLAARCPSALSSLRSAPGDRRQDVGLFGRKQSESDKPNPQLDAVLERLSALSLPQLAAEVMTEGFSSNYDPGDTGRTVAVIAAGFCPAPQLRLRDTTVRAQKRAMREASDPTSTQSKSLQLQDLVREGLQALEKASLVEPKTTNQGEATMVGYVTTRLGRDALEQNAVDRALAGGTG